MSVQVNALKDTIAFKPIKVGKNELEHRIVFAPSTRLRSLPDHTPSDLNLKYYDDRTKVPGSFVITEGTFVSPQAGGMKNVPGIWSDKHVKAWKKIIDRVHKNKSYIGIQAWFLGRAGEPDVLKAEGQEFVAPSALYYSEESEKIAKECGNPIRALTEKELHDLIYETYTKAAKNAVEAGFDYFELHSAHGYFLDQFLHPSTNQRTDKYGGSIENRARFLLELIDHLIDIIGAEKLAVRLSPWATIHGVESVTDDVHPYATYGYILHELQKRANKGKQLAYVSVVEPRVNGVNDRENTDGFGDNEFVEQVWKGTILRAGNYTYDAPSFKGLLNDIKNGRTLAGFSRYYISNPDLVHRLKEGIALTPYDRSTFYYDSNWGYNTFNRADENKVYDEAEESKVFPKEITE